MFPARPVLVHHTPSCIHNIIDFGSDSNGFAAVTRTPDGTEHVAGADNKS